MINRFLAICLLIGGVATSAAAQLQVFTSEQTVRIVGQGGVNLLEIQPVIWGPDWAWTGLGGSFEATDGNGARGRFNGRMGGTDVPFTLTLTLQPRDAQNLEVTAELQAERPTELTAVVLAIQPGDALRGGRATAVDQAGRRQLDVPFATGSLSQGLQTLELRDRSDRSYIVQINPPAPATADGAARIVLASDRLAANQPQRLTLTLQLPQDANFMLSRDAVQLPANWDQWFQWRGTGHGENSAIDMSAWLDAPAGRHGRITLEGNELKYNGQRVRFWGLNAAFANCAPPRDRAERQAAFYARYGINAVRFHKYADGRGWAGINRNGAADFDPQTLDRMDYYVAQLKNRGIYTKLSANFGSLPLGPTDLQNLSFASEFTPNNEGWARAMQGQLWFSTELQDLQMAQLIKLLEHTNPHAGRRYADDPAVMCVEMVNENSIFFYTTMSALQESPTTRRLAGEAFYNWLRNKYASEESLLQAWGRESIGTFKNERLGDESWQQGKIYPVGNPWFFDPDQLNGSQAGRKQRLLDTMHFMYDQQNAFYDRFYQAIRNTGYEGEIIASNWQAGRTFSHYLNLHSDARIGMVDRHNYFGGAGTMVAAPGSGSLSSGMQQVDDRPFMLSEWLHVFPNEYGVEGPAIIGAYGMGLNGWDVSYMFQNGDEGRFRNELREQWDAVAPQVLGVFPAVARQIYRGDVQQSDLIFARNVHVPSLTEGRLGFDDRVTQDYDVKEFGSDAVPAATLAIGRSVVRYTEQFEPTPTVDISRYTEGGAIRSATGQLAWTPGQSKQNGHFTINTPGTQAVIGFASGQALDLADVSLTPATEFAAIYVTAHSPGGAIATDNRLLITTLARIRNTDMKFVAGAMVDRGRAPMRVEPVAVQVQLKRPGRATIHILDHDGRRTGKTASVENGRARLNSAQTQAIYYEVEFGGE